MSGAPDNWQGIEQVDSTFAESRQRQLELWNMTLRARYLGILAVAALAMLPIAGPHGRWLTITLIVVGLPYNAVYDRIMRRRAVLSPALAFSDQVLAVAFLAMAPELVAPILLVMLAIDATSSVAFGRKVAAESAAVGALGAAGVLLVTHQAGGWPVLLVYLVTSPF